MVLGACYIIVDCPSCPDPEQYARELLLAGAQILQLRWKGASSHELSSLAKKLVALRRELRASTLIVVNDDVEAALQAEADGVHLGQDDGSVGTWRERGERRLIVGRSTHTIEQVIASTAEPVDYIGFGPIFPSPTKSGHAEVTGVDGLRLAVSSARCPVVAIGGVTQRDAQALFDAGAESCAVISDAVNARATLPGYLKEWEQLRSSARASLQNR